MNNEQLNNQTDFHAAAHGAFHSGSGDINVWGSFVPNPTVPTNGSNLPQRFANFVGRDEDIKGVLEALASRAWIVTIDGMGGIGKTTLALEVAHRCRRRELSEITVPHFTGYIWTSARDKPGFGLVDIVQEINQTIAPQAAHNLTFDFAVGLTKRVLSAEPRLLIIDNFETVKDEALHRFLRDELPDPSKVLITSAHHIGTGEKVINLSGLSIREAVSLLRMEAQRWNIFLGVNDEPMLELVAQKSFGIPFVLKWVLENVYNGKSLDWALKALENATADDVFDYIFTRSLSVLDEQTRHLFRAMAAFKAPVGIQDIRVLMPQMVALPERIGKLVRLSLLEDNRRLVEDDKQYWLHPFTRYLAERELAQAPEVQIHFRDILANHFVMSESTRGTPIFDNCEKLGIEADNYFEAIAWIQSRKRPNDMPVWDRVSIVLEALRQCRLIVTPSQKDIEEQASTSVNYSHYLRRLLLTIAEALRLAGIPTEFQNILPFGLALRGTFESLSRTGTVEAEIGVTQQITTPHDLLKLSRKIVILGDAGSGKTTLLRFLAQFFGTDSTESQYVVKLLCQEELDHLTPVFIPLSNIRSTGALSLKDILHEIYAKFKELGFDDPQSFVSKRLEKGGCLILLDGLNEIQPSIRESVIFAIEGFSRRYTQNWIIITTRIADYQQEPRDFLHLELQSLSQEQIRNYVEQVFDDDRQGEAFYNALMANHEIRDLSANPLFLSMMIRVYKSSSQLPINRGDLVGKFVDLILVERDTFGEMTPEKGITASEEKSVLATIALQMQVEGRTTIDEQEGKALVEPAASGDFRISEELHGKQLLRTLAERGILEESEPSSYRFAHLTFQEYLAAYALTQTRESIETLLKYVNQASWQEVILLFGKILERQGREKFENLIRSFVTYPDAKGQAAILAGRLLQEVGPQPMSSALQQAVAKKLIQLFSSSMSTSVKVEAGSVLGHIGDPRLIGEMMEVPSGSFIMGGNMQPNDTHPAHEIYLPDFRIGLYLVTNTEFAKFVEAGGYDNAGYWSASGWLYRQRKKWIYPEYWQKNPWNQPNYPIVGVSFFEAVAYCRWLTDELHAQGLLHPERTLFLPTEAMWEKAARGQNARLWPWGDHFHPQYANTAENDIGSTSAVGIFPEGASAYGVLDMCGNVWEWCSSIYSSYPYKVEDGREDFESVEKRVLRGGSWASQRSQSTAIYRHTSSPETRQNIIGFRIVEISNLRE